LIQKLNLRRGRRRSVKPANCEINKIDQEKRSEPWHERLFRS
jgi:hypothetical protein